MSSGGPMQPDGSDFWKTYWNMISVAFGVQKAPEIQLKYDFSALNTPKPSETSDIVCTPSGIHLKHDFSALNTPKMSET